MCHILFGFFFVPDNVPLIPSVETRILPFKWCALQRLSDPEQTVQGHQSSYIYNIKELDSS